MNSPVVLPYQTNPFLRATGSDAVGISADTASVSACMALQRTKTYALGPDLTISARGFIAMHAAFNRESQYTQVATCTINNHVLQWYYNSDAQTVYDPRSGTYHSEDPTGIAPTSSAKFSFTGFGGDSFNDSVPVCGPIELTKLRALDTISLKKNFRISYTAPDLGDSIVVELQPDENTSLALLGPAAIDSARIPEQYITRRLADTGQITFSPDDLKPYKANRYLQLQLSRWKYFTRSLTSGKNCGFYSDYTLTIPIYITE